MFEKPDNSFSSFKYSHKIGITGIETDLLKTKDGKFVLCHDNNLKRTTGQDIDLKDINYKDIKNYLNKIYLDYGVYFESEEMHKEKIVLLEDFFAFLKKTDLLVNIDIKTEEEADFFGVLELAEKYGVVDRIIIGSFGDYDAKGLRKRFGNNVNTFFSSTTNFLTYILFFLGLLPFMDIKYDVFVTTLYFKSMVDSELFLDSNLAYYYCKFLSYMSPMLKVLNWHLKRRGTAVVYFCVNEEEDVDYAVKLGANGIIADNPLEMSNYIKTKFEGRSS